MDVPTQARQYPILNQLCEMFPRQVELAVDTESGEMLMELRIRIGEHTIAARETMDSVTDIDRAAKAIMTT